MTQGAAIIVLAAVMAAPLGVAAQPAAQSASQSVAAEAVRALLDQAAYWRGQFQDDKAEEAVTRVLALDPQNADALAFRAQAAAENGDAAAARSALARLKSARPDDLRIPGVEQVLQTGPLDGAALADARSKARAGRPAEAVAAYRRAFKADAPPPPLAAEFYQALADTDENWQVPRAGLAAALRANPQDLRSQLAYAELLSYHDETRREGIDRLGKLAKNPILAEQATKDLRQSLTWLPAVTSSIPQYEIYLAEHPDDAGIANLADAAKRNSADLRNDGFASANGGKLPEADAQFTAALNVNPEDSDAMMGLGLVRLREKRQAEGVDLLQRASQLDPAKAEQFQKLIKGATERDTGGAAGPNQAAAAHAAALAVRAVRAQYARVAILVDRGEFAQAEALLRHLAGKRPSAGDLAYLADIEARAGRWQEAEAGYRGVLAAHPRNVQALAGLARVLSHQGEQDVAEALFAQAAALPGGAAVGAAHAAALRLQAEQATNPEAQMRLFRAASAANPGDPWLRLALARALLGQLDAVGAGVVMAPVASAPRPDAAHLQAAIYFANDIHDDRQVADLLRRLPTADQTEPMQAIRAGARARQDVRDARASGKRAEERERLLNLAAEPDPTGMRVAALSAELVRIGDKRAAREAVRLALAASPATAEQRVAYAGALLAAQYPGDARRITQGVTANNGVMARQLTAIDQGAAVALSDKLNAAGNPAAAYDELAPRLAAAPENPDLNMALARLYSSRQEPAKALRITQGLLEQNPNNAAVQSSAVYVALAAGDFAQAGAIAQAATAQFPDQPQPWVDLANVERARGHSGAALRALQTAKALQDKQRAAQQQSARDAPRRYAQYIPITTATDAAPDPVSRQYVPYDADILLPIEAPVSVSYAPFSPAPVQMAQTLQPPAFGNPFHPGATPLPSLDEPAAPAGAPQAASRAEWPDPLTAQINQDIDQLKQEIAPRLEGSLSLRGRTGGEGLARLFEVAAPLQASFSPSGYGRVTVAVTPTYLYSGNAAAASDQLSFGTSLFAAHAPLRSQSAFGTALDIGYAYGMVTADIGASPLGFQQQNIVGGIELAPRLDPAVTLRALAERRAVTDSILSYAGAKDVASGATWGGVTRSRFHLQLGGQLGLVDYYAGAGAGYLAGHNVASNSEIDAGAGVGFAVWRSMTQEIRLGTDLVYFGYRKNLGGFTLGQGGYFSPQQFFAVLFPVHYRQQVTPELSYALGGSVGFQTFRSKDSDTFPDDGARQANLGSAPVALTIFPGVHSSGIAGGVSGEIDYRLRANFHVGARAGFDRSGDFTEGAGLVYARYVFDDTL